jgi:hypothetical protein
MTNVSAKTQQMNTAYAPPPQFNAGTNVRSFIAPAIQATLIASAPVLEKIPLEITRAALETAYKLPSFKPAPFNIINLIKSPAAWGSVLKGLAGAAAGYVSGSGAEIEFAKLQGQIPGYVDGRSAQLGSAALDKMSKNAGSLFSKLTPDQRGRLLMGAAPLMQALTNYEADYKARKQNSNAKPMFKDNEKLSPADFHKGMIALLRQVQTGKKAEIKLPQKKEDHKNHGLGDHGQQTKLLPGKKTTVPNGGGRAAPVVKGVELEPLVKKDGTRTPPKKSKTGKQQPRMSGADNSGGGSVPKKTVTINGKEIHIRVGETHEFSQGNTTYYFKANPNGIQVTSSGGNINIGNASDGMNININAAGGMSIGSGKYNFGNVSMGGNSSVNMGGSSFHNTQNTQADRDFAQAGRDFAKAGQAYAKAQRDAAKAERDAAKDARHAARDSGRAAREAEPANTNLDDITLDQAFQMVMDKYGSIMSAEAKGYFESLFRRVKQTTHTSSPNDAKLEGVIKTSFEVLDAYIKQPSNIREQINFAKLMAFVVAENIPVDANLMHKFFNRSTPY